MIDSDIFIARIGVNINQIFGLIKVVFGSNNIVKLVAWKYR